MLIGHCFSNWTLFFHRWMGILIAVLSLYAWYIRKGSSEKKLPKKITNIAGITMLAVTGHLGGNMTHGSDYLLEYAPTPIQKLLGYGSGDRDQVTFENPDSVYTYHDIIFPIFEKKCLGCHSDDVQNGGLNMASIEAITKGGDGGPVIVGGDISSELLRRVTLPVSSAKFMPTSGMGLTYHEIKILEWWIAEGAEYDVLIKDIPLSPSVQSTLLGTYGLDMTPRPWIEKKAVAFLDSLTFEEMRSTGLKVNQLAQNNGWIEVSLPYGEKVEQVQLESLSKAAQQITWLNLSNSGLTDQHMSYIGALPHLTRLRVHGNDITTSGVTSLSNLKHLESLNITNTQVDDAFLEALPSFPALKKLYVWQSNITPESISDALTSHPNIDVEAGIALE